MGSHLLLVCTVTLSVFAGLLLGILAAVGYRAVCSKRFRVNCRIPNILGTWQCQWYDDAQDSAHPKVEDAVELLKWTSNGSFLGVGHQPQFHLSYPIVGEIDPSRVVTLEYRAAHYPYELNRGVVCLELSRDGNTMDGRWLGRRSSNKIGGGRVHCVRLPDTAATPQV